MLEVGAHVAVDHVDDHVVVVVVATVATVEAQSRHPVLQLSQLLNGPFKSLIIKQVFKKVGCEAL